MNDGDQCPECGCGTMFLMTASMDILRCSWCGRREALDTIERPRRKELEPAPPKDWQERLHKVAELTRYISETGDGTEAGFNSIDVAISRLKDVATLKQQIKELEDANRYLARSNGKLILELRQKTPRHIDAALNEGDGVYRP